MKTFKRIICVVLSLTMCLSSFIVFANAKTDPVDYYTTAGTATKNDIEISNNILNKARKATKENTKSFTYTAVLSNQYDVHIYHFVAPSNGYYAFYTTGWKDTVIRIYEDQNFIIHSYKSKAADWDDDSGRVDSNQFNGRVVKKLDAGEDYYICVRVCYYFTGEYTLHVEPNDDKILSSYGNCSRWTMVDYPSSLIGYNSQNNETIICETRQYLTQPEVLLWGFSTWPELYKKMVEKYPYMDLQVVFDLDYYGKTREALDKANLIINSLMTGLSVFNVEIPTAVSISVSALQTILEKGFLTTDQEKDRIRSELQKKCGFDFDIVDPKLIVKNTHTELYIGLKLVCNKGALYTNRISSITTTSHIYNPVTQQTEEIKATFPYHESLIIGTNNIDVRIGVPYEKGIWCDAKQKGIWSD